MIIIFLNSMMMILAHIEFKIPFDLAYEKLCSLHAKTILFC